jgi:hypothetical protein
MVVAVRRPFGAAAQPLAHTSQVRILMRGGILKQSARSAASITL